MRRVLEIFIVLLPFASFGRRVFAAVVATQSFPANLDYCGAEPRFYSPGIGPFDYSAKAEGTFGKQSFGFLNFRGYDQTSGNEFDDVAYGYNHAESDHSFVYWADGVIAHHSQAGNDSTNEAGAEVRSLKSGFVGAIDGSFENGSWVRSAVTARNLNGFVDVHKPNYEVNYGYQDISPNYNPIDGFTNTSEVRGPTGLITFSGSNRAVKSYMLYYRRFSNGSDLYVNFGTPAANQTLNRLVVKYVMSSGGRAGG